MDETANEIETHIDRTRERLGSNLRELEERVDEATDWQEHFRARPQLFLGAAFVGGVIGDRASLQGLQREHADTKCVAPKAVAQCARRPRSSGTTSRAP